MAYIYGTAANETLIGTSGDDTINGNGGDDQIFGGAGNDQISAYEGRDRLEGGDGDDTLYSGGGDDILLGGAGADYLVGGYGRDTLDGGDGADRIAIEFDESVDTLTGGSGADVFETYIWSGVGYGGATISTRDVITDFSIAQGDTLSLGVNGGRLSGNGDYLLWFGAITTPGFSLVAGAALPDAPDPGFVSVSTWTSGGSSYLIIDTNSNGVLNDGDVVIEFQGAPALTTNAFKAGTFTAVVGTASADTWIGGADADIYFGFGGDDVISGQGGADQLSGGAGNDTLNGGAGADVLLGEAGDDTLNGDDGDDVLSGGQGGDTLNGGAGNDTLFAGQMGFNGYADSLGSVNRLNGGDGDDKLYASSGKDILDGGAGNDLLTVAYGEEIPGDIFNGGDGDDEINASNVTMDGGAGADRLWIKTGNIITGGAGADMFYARYNDFWTWGQYGFSTITDFNAAEGDRIDLGAVTDYTIGSLVFRGAVTTANFSVTLGQRYDTDDLGEGATQLWTWSTADATYLFMDLDHDGVISDQDMVVKFSNKAAISATSFKENYFTATLGTSGNDTFTGSAGGDVYYGMGGADQIHGGEGGDILRGNAGDDSIWGDAGDDNILGGDGNDTLDGGAGADHIAGGLGSDVIRGGDGDDDLYAGLDFNNVSGDANAVDVIYGDAGADRIVGVPGVRGEFHGGDGNDSIYGSGQLFGDAGDDSLQAGDAGAVIHGGDGADQIHGGAGPATIYGDAGADSIYGSMRADVIYADLGDNYVYGSDGDDQIFLGAVRVGETQRIYDISGGAGDDTFSIQVALGNTTAVRIGGDIGVDTLDLRLAKTTVTVDLGVTGSQDTGMGLVVLQSIEAVQGGDFGATLKGDGADNRLLGGASADTLSGGGGSDILVGNGGADVLDGGDGVDVAQYFGLSTNYSWTTAADGSVVVKDLRANSADGTDTLKNVELLRFSDRSVLLTSVTAPAANDTAFASILRTTLNGALQSGPYADLALKMTTSISAAEAAQLVVKAAVSTTSVASLSYQFFTGKVPSGGGIDFLISPTSANGNNLNSAYYAQFDTVNRYINFAVNLGKNGDGKDAFAAKYGALSLFEATKQAYAEIFGGTPTDAKTHALIDTRVDYLAAYGGDGAEGIGTKAAMVGFLLAAAATEGLGVMARSNEAWLTDLADGSAPFAVNLVDPANGYYKSYWSYNGG
ncbi:hypothetical protein [Caulobacter sp. RL271]|uniref:Calcium-binding protein n=1 Tax=Caulobacter segnis TaxID=88688 RepID=A0ABY4ZYA1_9CAUL|nr:hypothetical protein [Caulobacter segnis]USQ97609.1 hypothetical protein MZV50_08780 [Caulobacter segnis]